MSDIELVIKISEDSYKATCIGSMVPLDVENVVNAIKNGTPLEQESILDKITTNGDVIKAMFSVVGFTPLTWHISSDRKEGFHVHIEDCFKDDFQLTVSKDWWNAPYKAESEGVRNDIHR